MSNFKISKADPSVYVVMLTFNGQHHLEYSLPSLLKTDYSNFVVILVNNASIDESVEFVKINFPEVKIISNKKNLAWAGGNNVGIRYALEQNADYIALVNDDVLFDPRWIKEGVNVAEKNPLIGIAGFDIFDKKVNDSKGSFTLALKEKRDYEVRETDNVRGVAMLVRQSVFENIGLIDETYFIYGEENDFEIRAQRAGYYMVNISIPIWHFSEGTMSKKPILRSYLSIRNTLRFTIKNKLLKNVISTIFYLFNVGCNPAYKIDPKDYTTQRYRPKSPLFNFMLITICVCWNLIFLPKTLWRRRKDSIRIRHTRNLLKTQHSRRKE